MFIPDKTILRFQTEAPQALRRPGAQQGDQHLQPEHSDSAAEPRPARTQGARSGTRQ